MSEAAGAERGPQPGDVERRGCLARVVRFALKGLVLVLLLCGLYVGAAEVLARMPGGGREPTENGEYVVYVTTNGVHVDLWLPVWTDVMDWAAWIPPEVPLGSRTHASFGWGDRGFYTQVPTWGDLTPGVALRGALLPSPTAMRVASTYRPHRDSLGVDAFPIGLDRAEYAALVEFVQGSFRVDATGALVLIDHPGYTERDRFFEGEGSYHLFRTCNEWVSNGLRAAGIAAPAWTPFERNVLVGLR